jgi:effector-binding domain-containing protein
MVSDLEIKSLSAQPALLIRTHTLARQLGHVLAPSFATVLQYLGELGESPAGPSFAVYYNNDMANLDVGIGFPVAKALSGKGEIQASEIPAGKYATCLYTGPYSHIRAAYTALTQYLQENHVEATIQAYEMYLDDPSKTPPEELKTTVMLPLKTT